MSWLMNPDSFQNAIELVCCFMTVLTVFVSYILSMR